MIGIENISKLTVAIGKIGTSIGDVLADGKVTLADIPEAVELVTVIPSFVTIKYTELAAEIKDIDASEQATLAELFKVNFMIANHDNIEKIIEEGIEFLFVAVKFIGTFIKKPAEVPAEVPAVEPAV